MSKTGYRDAGSEFFFFFGLLIFVLSSAGVWPGRKSTQVINYSLACPKGSPKGLAI